MQDVGSRAVGKASRALVPLLLIMYFVNYLDRVNIGFAALTMNHALGLSASVFGLGASIFFVGYVILEVPSNLILARVGARLWIARIMVTWGIVSGCMAFVSSTYSFYLVRFFLGVAEAGFFPGIIFYLTNWFPASHRARLVGFFMVGIPLSGLIGAPLSTSIMTALDGTAGLMGWQWMFIVEAVPSVLLGIACIWLLPDRPSDLASLSAEERNWLQRTIAAEHQERERAGGYSVLQSLSKGTVWALAAVLFLASSALYGSIFWLPQVVKTFGLSNAAVGWVSAIPYLVAVPVMVLWTRRSDHAGERAWHVAIALFVAAAGFAMAGAFLSTPIVAMVGLSLSCAGIYAAFPIFWSLPTSFLTGTAAAAAIAFIAALGNFSGLIAPSLIGWSKDLTGGFNTAMFGLAIALLIGGCLVVAISRHVYARTPISATEP